MGQATQNGGLENRLKNVLLQPVLAAFILAMETQKRAGKWVDELTINLSEFLSELLGLWVLEFL